MTTPSGFGSVDNPYYEDPRVALIHGDCRAVMGTLAEGSMDAIVTDPPYEIGFMESTWDESGVAFDVETWRQAFRCLKPGGHMLVFGGTRTFHRVAVAIEDAGFEIRDCLSWLYGQGMPKARAVLKPGWEPIVVARKPFKGTAAANVREHGTGGLAIERCRLGDRWPANVCLDDEAAEMLNDQAGERPTGAVRPYLSSHDPDRTATSFMRGGRKVRDFNKTADSGGASRFFYVSKASKAERPVVEGVQHPTVKPLDLMRWLVRLATPDGDIVLDPFAGSGSTVEACVLEGFRCVAIENHGPYLPLTVERLSKPLQANLGATHRPSELVCDTCGRTAYWCDGHVALTGAFPTPRSGRADG